MMSSGRASEFIRNWDSERIYEEAGNGAQELRNWLLIAGALEDRPGKTTAYAPVPEWCTGTAVMEF